MKRILSISTLFVTLVAPQVRAQNTTAFREARHWMVEQEVEGAGVKNPRVLESMRKTPRHEFMPLNQRKYAYYDMAVAIGEGQTISPPFIVAYMTEQLDPQKTDKVLEIGTGSGYQAAVLSPLVREVYTIEIVPSLGRKAERALKRLGYRNVHVKVGDGFKGWPEHAPFDKIIVTCSPEKVPAPLVAQLREGGKMIIPVGERYKQNLYLLTKKNGRMEIDPLRATLFVPMTGAAEDRRKVKPDPLDPTVRNGSFEEQIGETEQPASWHYQRQLEMVRDEKEAREGKHYISFSNDDPGRPAQALQGFAIDGRQIAQLELTVWVRGETLRYGQDRSQWPMIVVDYYDESRAYIGRDGIGPWMGNFDWERQTARIDVPLAAREAILRIGLQGGIGTLSLDDLQMQAIAK